MTAFPKMKLSVWMFLASCVVAHAQSNGVFASFTSNVSNSTVVSAPRLTIDAAGIGLSPTNGRMFPPPKAQWIELEGVSPVSSWHPKSAGFEDSQATQIALAPPAEISELPTLLHNKQISSNEVSLGRGAGGDDYFHRAQYARIAEEGVLKQPAPVYGSELEHRIVDSFRPAVIHIGHTEFSCSIITAIARKNPFCLLSQTPINISF